MNNRKFSLIVCTYSRPESLSTLLKSIATQSVAPDEILIIDASSDQKTEIVCQSSQLPSLKYFQVNTEHRGLTKQRNYGISKVGKDIDYVCFLDDDIILSKDYFTSLINTYIAFPDAIGVGGYITNEVIWEFKSSKSLRSKFYFEEFQRQEPMRFQVRRLCGLAPDRQPCFLPSFGHGRSVSFLPPSGKIYGVEHFMGGVSSYKLDVLKKVGFSTFFEGYGLYEDADFCFRLLSFGDLYVNTAAQCEHHHDKSGRPDWFEYGKMVIRNGWYVWRIRFPKPSVKDKFRWRACSLLLILLTLGTLNRKSIREGMGRLFAWTKLFFFKPSIQS
ncbi:glycosyltransferase family 2 protein [Winogradskyella aurantiaca]|uniref:glycosyltransferase family 2 protein n=1 Tax=Winogradskyella aurantiaca TaxID=2219558 RepID=UPI000E1C4073|nr:glycosyltransferase family 2 protein [Winogradskyella aurantiaca]